MRAGGIQVAAEIAYVEAHHAGYVCAIHGRENTFGAGKRAQFLRGQNHPRHRGDVAEEHHSRPRTNAVTEQAQHLRGVLNWLG